MRNLQTKSFGSFMPKGLFAFGKNMAAGIFNLLFFVKYRNISAPNYKILAGAGVLLLALTGTNQLQAAIRTASVAGNWNSTTTWGGLSAPTSADDVVINSGITVTVNVNAQCLSLSFVAGTNGTVSVNPNCTLAVTNAVTLRNAANANVTALITGSGTLTCGSLVLGNATAPTTNNTTRTHRLTSTINALTISNNLTINSYFASTNRRRNGVFTQSSGTLTVNGSIATVNANAANTSTFTLGNSSPTLVLAGATPFSISATGTNTITLNGTGSTVNYNRAGTQTVYPVNYANLTLAGTSAKTLQTGTTSISGNFTTSGSATVTGVTGLTIGGDVNIGNGTTFTSGNYTHSIGGNWINNGIFTAGTGTVNLTGSGKNVSGATTTFYNLAINSSDSISLATSINVSRILTLANGILKTSTSNLLSVTYTNVAAITGGSATSFIKGPVRWTLPSSLVSGSTYNFPVGKGTTYLPFSLVNPTTGTGVVTAQVEAFDSNPGGTYDATISLLSTTEYWSLTTSGNFTNSSVSASRPTTISPLNSIGGNATAANGVYTDLGGTAGVSGVMNSNLVGSNRYFVLARKVLPPALNTSGSPLTGFGYTAGYGPSSQQSFTVDGSNLVGNITVTPPADYEISLTSGSNFQSTPLSLVPVDRSVATTTIYARLKAGLPAANYNAENIAVSTSGATTQNVSCSGTVYTPTITTSVSSLAGFSYPVGYGPSAEQTFTVSGTHLVGNITVVSPANFEISTASGASFVATGLITLPATGGNVPTTTIYVRMKAGIPLGPVDAENIEATSADAVSKNVSCSGTVADQPLITTSVSSLNSFTYVYRNGPSAPQTFTVSGSNLIANVVVTPPADFEISTNGSTYVSTPVTLIQSGGILASTTIYARLKIGVGIGSYSENIVASTTAGLSKNVTCNGSVEAGPTIITVPSYLGTLCYTLGSGPSAAQSFVVTGTNLTSNISLTAPANFQISASPTTGFGNSLTLSQSGGSVNATVYARLSGGLSVGTYGTSNITISATNAVVKTVGLYGAVVGSASPTIFSSKSTISGFGYEQGKTTTSTQSFMVSGASLSSQNLQVSLDSTTYEISLNENSGFQSTPIILTGTLTGTTYTVNATPIYVRLKLGQAARNYTNTIQLAAGSTTASVSLVGIVFKSPLVTAGGGGTYCEGSTIALTSIGADIQNRYWQGPNSFYSTSQDLNIPNATAAMSGTYTVTGNVYVGGNLIFNGDFELGNTGIGSSYSYVTPGTSTSYPNGNLWPESTYTIDADPYFSHHNFSHCPDHTIGGATPTGKQMIINGSPVAGVVIWSQSVPVIPGSSYEFSYWVQTVVGVSPSQLQLYVNGVPAGPTYTADLATCSWKQFVYNTTAGASTTAVNLELINQNTIANGNDFTLDDIIFKQILPAKDSAVVTVSPILPVSVTVSASANPVYNNTPVTYTATPVNGGNLPAYQWKVNGNNVGANSPELVYTPLDQDVISCTLTSSLQCVTNNPATDAVQMTVNYRTNYWIGSIDTDWGKPGNWTANYIPLTGEDVEYATIANNNGNAAVRDLQLDMDRTIGSLINATDKRLLIPAGKGLVVNNTITTDGNPDRIYIYSSSTGTANGSLIFHNPENYPVSATVEMYSKAHWDLNQPVNHKYSWQYFGIPVKSIKTNPVFYGSYVRKWYESGDSITNHWKQLQNDSVLHPFLGYEICQAAPKTIVFKGELVNQDFSSGQMAITSTALFPGQHIFANPYTGAIDIRQLGFGSGTEASVYLYNTGTYAIWELDGGRSSSSNEGQYMVVPKSTAGLSGLPRQVPSMQAMLVKALSPTNGTFNINYNTVSMKNSELQRAPKEDKTNLVSTRIDVVGSSFSDIMWIIAEPSCTEKFDNGWDGFKMLGNALAPQIYGMQADGNYQVNANSDLNGTNIGFRAGIDTEYTLVFNNFNIEQKYKAILLSDVVEKKTVDMTLSGSTYKFNATSTPSTVNRFKIIAIPLSETKNNSKISLTNYDDVVVVNNQSESSGNLHIYDTMGRLLVKKLFGPNAVTAIQVNLPLGAYILNATNGIENASKRVILR
ncbi:MAG TPA: T9SS type A sorting domain-containing protein [Paludibacter sp.]|nr:T9SS type A sorting domain-containing protein [Paludibacter sp.]